MLAKSHLALLAAAMLALSHPALQGQTDGRTADVTTSARLIGPPVTKNSPLRLDIPHSWNPINAYRPTKAPTVDLANSSRIDSLIKDGVLQLSLEDAITLALENNLDIAIARYNIPIAAADVLRTRAGGVFRGVNTGIVQNTPGAGVGGFGTGASGAGAGGTTGGAGGAGTGASGLVQSTLGTGTVVPSFDPTITSTFSLQHDTQPLSNLSIYGIQLLHTNTLVGNAGYQQAFPTGTSIAFTLNDDRVTTNSPSTFLNPELDTFWEFGLQQQLLAGFGFGPNLRYLRIARNNQKISDEAFKLQIISTVTQVADMYWDLVTAFEDERVRASSLDFASQRLTSARKQLELQAIPAIDVLKDEEEVASQEEDLTIARSQLHFQELLIKNALTKNLDDPGLEAMPVHPTDVSEVSADNAAVAKLGTENIIQEALATRIELGESEIDLQNREISRRAADNGLLPSLALNAFYAGAGLAGRPNAGSTNISSVPGNFNGALGDAFQNKAPDYYVGFSLNMPLRNRVAKSDQYRSELELRQAQLRLEQLRKQIRIEVRNAQYSLEQSVARVQSAAKARELAARTFEITRKEQQLGAGSELQTLTSRHDLATAESALVAARTANRKAGIELDRAIGRTLEANKIQIDSVRASTSSAAIAVP